MEEYQRHLASFLQYVGFPKEVEDGANSPHKRKNLRKWASGRNRVSSGSSRPEMIIECINHYNLDTKHILLPDQTILISIDRKAIVNCL